jgi:hypothetical protein
MEGMPEWGSDGRGMRMMMLSAAHTQQPSPLLTPMPKHSRVNSPLVAAIVVLMVLGIGAIFCCCYQWEGQLRLQARARAATTTAGRPPERTDGDLLQVFSGGNSQRVSSFSVVMPGDNDPRYIAWATPHGSSMAPAIATEQLPTFHHVTHKNTRLPN